MCSGLQPYVQVRKLMLEAAPHGRVLLLHHPDCSQHATGDTHQVHPPTAHHVCIYAPAAATTCTCTCACAPHLHAHAHARAHVHVAAM